MPIPLYVSNRKGENVPIKMVWLIWLYLFLFVIVAELGTIMWLLVRML